MSGDVLKLSWRHYAIASGVFLGSLGLVWMAPAGLKSISAIPGVGSLVYALYQLLRDESNFKKQLEFQHKQEIFSLSVSSHMAAVAFDRYIAFCDEYLPEFKRVFEELVRDAPKGNPGIVSNLRDVRLKHCLWISHEIMQLLDKAEHKIRMMEVSAQIVQGTTDGEIRQEHIDREHRAYMEILGVAPDGEDDRNALDKIVTELKIMLGASELCDLRRQAISSAVAEKPRGGL